MRLSTRGVCACVLVTWGAGTVTVWRAAEPARTAAPPPPTPPAARPCHYVLFANGGKCGSTALYMYLERAYAPHIRNLGEGKEPCYARPPARMCTDRAPYLLDGCPRGWAERRWGFREARNRTSVVVLVREQADRMQSLINDAASSGAVGDPDAWATARMLDRENNFTRTHAEAAALFARVVVVHHDELLSVAGVRAVFARLFPALPVPPVVRPIHPNRYAQRDPRHRQRPLALPTRWKIEDAYRATNCAFFRRTGVYIAGDDCGGPPV